jgi:hypothetical protein
MRPTCGQIPMASATRSQEWSSTPSSLRRYVVVTASDEWSRNALTVSTDSPASRLSFAALWRRICSPVGWRPAATRYRRKRA